MAIDTEHRPSPQRAESTPYFYPGGTVAGVTAPAGWYSTPWWRTVAISAISAIVPVAPVQRGFMGS